MKKIPKHLVKKAQALLSGNPKAAQDLKLLASASDSITDCFLEICARYKLEPHGIHLLRTQRSGLTLKKRYKILSRDGFRCRLCGASAAQGSVLEVDHRLSLAKGGNQAESNLWTLCFACNRGKGTL